MANQWFVMIPPSYASSTTAEKELVDFVIEYQYPSAAWTAANSGQVVQGAEGNSGNPQVSEQLVKWQGPFATEAAAHTAANPQQQSPNPVNDAANAAENSVGLGNLIAKAGTFFDDLTSKNFWLRAGEVILGLILIAVGVAKLTHAVPIATKVAKTVGATAAVAA